MAYFILMPSSKIHARERKGQMLKIGDFSKLTRISIRMLRHYDEIGLLKPDSIDTFTGYRYYSAAQLPVANRVTTLKNMGFSLAVISEIMSQYHDAGQVKRHLQIKLAEVKEQLEQTQYRLNSLEATIKRLGKDDTAMKYDVSYKEIPERYVASLRRIISTYQDESVLWNQMSREIGCKLQMANPSYSLAVFHDEGYKESDVDVEIQVAVQGKYENTENVVFKTVGPAQVAAAVYKGSYEKLTEVNEAVATWISDNGYDYSGPMFCIYHVSPGQDPNPDNWVTEVCYPVKKA
jgi:DNA-binding transcriptional MerR regulator